MFEVFDYPRQAIYNLGRSASRLFSGDASMDDLYSALPGLATIASVPFTGPIGAMAIGAGAQGLGHLSDAATDSKRFESTATSDDLFKALGGDPEESPWASAAFGVATDPISIAMMGPASWAKKTFLNDKVGSMLNIRKEVPLARAFGTEGKYGLVGRGSPESMYQAANMDLGARSMGGTSRILEAPENVFGAIRSTARPDVIGHEVGHGITQRAAFSNVPMSDLPFSMQPAAKLYRMSQNPLARWTGQSDKLEAMARIADETAQHGLQSLGARGRATEMLGGSKARYSGGMDFLNRARFDPGYADEIRRLSPFVANVWQNPLPYAYKGGLGVGGAGLGGAALYNALSGYGD